MIVSVQYCTSMHYIKCSLVVFIVSCYFLLVSLPSHPLDPFFLPHLPLLPFIVTVIDIFFEQHEYTVKEADQMLEVFIVKNQTTEVTYILSVEVSSPDNMFLNTFRTQAFLGSDFLLNRRNPYQTTVVLEVPPLNERTGLSVTILNDRVPEGAELFALSLQLPSDIQEDPIPRRPYSTTYPNFLIPTTTVTIFGIDGK